jgi:PAS domain S-box-containing protein
MVDGMRDGENTPVADGSNPAGGVPRPQTFSQSFAADLIDAMQDGFSVLGSDGVALHANPALCQMTGFSEEELVGQRPPHPYWPPEEYSQIQEALEETLKGSGLAFELTFMRKNGQRFPAIVTAFTVIPQNGDPICYAATVKDITERKQSENALRDWNQTLELRVGTRTRQLEQSENRFRQLVEATFEGIVISENGVIIDANRQIAAMLNYDLVEIIGLPVVDCVAPESRSRVTRRILDGIEGPYEFTGMRKDGSTLPMEAHGRMMEWNGKATRVTVLRNLSAAKGAEARLASQKVELDQALRLALVSEVSAGIVHQIGQPLSAIGAHVSAFATRYQAGEVETDDCHHFLDELAANVARMRDSVIRLKALANPEQAKRLPVNLNALITESINLVQAANMSEHFEIVTEMDSELPLLPADKVQLSQVVINLVRNAMDACVDFPPERRIIQITTRAIEGQGVELGVRDSGTGIAPSVMIHLFDPFFTTKPEGFGIGLRLSRTIVEAHGGTLEGRNNPDGIGATFRVLLPLGSKLSDTKA